MSTQTSTQKDTGKAALMMTMQLMSPIKNDANDNALLKIEVKGLNVYYGKFRALNGINLDVRENQITAIIGPSGCGKSTLLRSLNRMNDLIPSCRVRR